VRGPERRAAAAGNVPLYGEFRTQIGHRARSEKGPAIDMRHCTSAIVGAVSGVVGINIAS
jgi:hypothetical protein